MPAASQAPCQRRTGGGSQHMPAPANRPLRRDPRGVGGCPGPWPPTHPHIREMFIRQKVRFIKGAAKLRPTLGTQTFGGPLPPPPPRSAQDKSSRGSVDTTKTRSDPQRVRMCSGERPIGAAKGKQPDTEALCQPPTPSATLGRPG